MTSAALILGIHGAGLLCALALAAWLSGRAPSTPEVRRLAAAVERAGLTFSWSQYRLVAVLTGIALTAGLALLGLWSSQGPVFSKSETGFWFGLTLLLGAASACLSVHFSTRLAARATASVAAAGQGAGEALLLGARASGASAILAEALCSLGFLGCLLLAGASKGTDADAIAASLVRITPGYALGAAIASAVLHRGAAVLQSAGQLASLYPGLGATDSRNPAAVSRLLGESVGRTVAATADFFLAASLGNLALALVAARVVSQSQAGVALLAWVALPFAIRAFGVLATCFGTFVVRTTEREDVQVALMRGAMTTLVTLVGGVMASAFWLTGGAGATHVGVVVVAVLLVSFAGGLVFRAISSASTNGAADGSLMSHVARSFSVVLTAVPSALVLLAVAFLASVALLPDVAQLGAQARPWIAAIVVAFLFALAPQWLAFQLGGVVSSAARGTLELSGADAHQHRVVSQLASGHAPLLAAARGQLSIAGAAAALLGALSLVRPPLDLVSIMTAPEGALWAACAPVGVALVVGFVGTGLGSAARAANGAFAEVKRQLEGFVAEDGKLELPEDFAPSYRTCIESCQRELRKNLLSPLLFVIVAPLLLGLLLRFTFDADAARTGLCVFGVASAVVGLMTASASLAAAGSLDPKNAGSRDPSRQAWGAAAPAPLPLDATERLTLSGASSLLDACGPMAQVLAKASIATSIVIACFLI